MNINGDRNVRERYKTMRAYIKKQIKVGKNTYFRHIIQKPKQQNTKTW